MLKYWDSTSFIFRKLQDIKTEIKLSRTFGLCLVLIQKTASFHSGSLT